jgi:hypothetical protein
MSEQGQLFGQLQHRAANVVGVDFRQSTRGSSNSVGESISSPKHGGYRG